MSRCSMIGGWIVAVSAPAGETETPTFSSPAPARERPAIVQIIEALRAPHEPTGPLEATTEQLIDPTTLATRQTGTLVLLHTNDIHDTLRPPANGPGGLAHVAGYVRAVRARRHDSIYVDAGDLLEKGDRVGVISQGEASYRAFAATGIDVTVPGNHDFAYGLDKLLANTRLVGLPIICTGMIYDDTGESVLPETLIKEVGDVRIGFIGATIKRSARSERPVTQFESDALGRRINELAVALEPTVDLTVLIIHHGTAAALSMSAAAPMLDVVVCGHTNEVTEKPVRAGTGALIVTVGRAGKWVGTLDLVVDCDANRIGRYTYEMVAMDHDRITPDASVTRLIEELERHWCPEDAAPMPSPTAGSK